jgi:hypothetical protein
MTSDRGRPDELLPTHDPSFERDGARFWAIPGGDEHAEIGYGGPEGPADLAVVTETGAESHRLDPSRDLAPEDVGEPIDSSPEPPATPAPAAAPRAHPFGRRRLWPAIVAGAIVTGVAVAGLSSSPLPAPSASPERSLAAGPVDGYFVSTQELRQRVAEAAHGDAPMAVAADDLLSWAAGAATESAHPVQPLVVVGTENVFVDDATRAYGLGLAYAASGDERFADAAAGTIRAWVETARSADDTCTDDGGCHTTLSISRAAPGLVFGASLIADSTAWSPHDDAAFRAWLRTVILPAASERTNNWGDAGTFMRVAVSDYLGDQAAFDAAIAKWRSMLDLVEADGRIPEEARRGAAGISYTQEALQYKIAVARMAELRGIDLWDAVGANGGSLKTALDRLAYYFAHPDEWPDATNADVPVAGPAWEIAYAHWPEPAWAPIVAAVRPYGDRGHSAIRWTTFTNGVPIGPLTAGGSPDPTSPGASDPIDPTGSPATPSQGPTLTGLRARLVETAAMGQVPLRLSWVGPGSADRVALEWSAGGRWRDLADSHRVRGSIVDRRPPGTVSYRGRLSDGGVAGPWLELANVVTDRIDASPATLRVEGSWSMAGGDRYSSASALSTTQAGATATWVGTASDVLIVGPVGPTRGRLDVIADGTLVETVSLRSSSYSARRVLATVHWSTTGEHTLALRAAGAAGRTVAIDELVRFEAGTLSSPASTP